MLIESLILSACTNLNNVRTDACSKALEAITIQYNVTPTLNNVENKVVKTFHKNATNLMGEQILNVAGISLKIMRDRQIRFQVVKNVDARPAITPTVNLNGGSVDFNWNF